MSERVKDGLIQAVLVVLPFLCFWGFVRGGVVADDDSVELFIPCLEHFRNCLKQGFVPLWNPYLLVGQTMAGFQNSPIYYPPNYLVRWMLPERLVVWTCLWHMAWGNLGHWRLARAWSMSRLAAFCVAVFLGFSASVYCEMERFPALQVLSWVPWMLLCLERAFSGSRRYLALAAVVLALQLLCGFPQIVHLEALVVAALAVFFWRARVGWTRLLVDLGTIGLLALLMSAPFLLCVSDYMASNVRSLATPSYFQIYPLGLAELAYNLVYATPEEFNIPFLVSVLAFCSIWQRSAPPHLRRVCWFLVVVGFLLALANATRYEFLVSWIPLYKSLRYRSRYVYLSCLALGWLAGFGVDALQGRLRPAQRGSVAAILALLAILVTLPNAASRNICYDLSAIRTVTAYRFLPKDKGFYRILVLPHLRNQYWNWGVFFGYSNVGGYNGAADLNVQKILHHAEYGTEMTPETAKNTLGRNMIRLRVPLDAPILRNFCLAYSLSSQTSRSAPEVHATKVPPVAHAFLPARLHLAEEKEALEQMSRVDFDPQLDCYLPVLPPAVAATGEPVVCEWTEVNCDHCKIKVPPQKETRLLVLSEVYDPGWEARAGAPLSVVRVNLALRGVVVPPGVSEIDLFYRPRGIRWGLPLAGTGILLTGLLWWHNRRRT